MKRQRNSTLNINSFCLVDYERFKYETLLCSLYVNYFERYTYSKFPNFWGFKFDVATSTSMFFKNEHLFVIYLNLAFKCSTIHCYNFSVNIPANRIKSWTQKNYAYHQVQQYILYFHSGQMLLLIGKINSTCMLIYIVSVKILGRYMVKCFSICPYFSMKWISTTRFEINIVERKECII